MKTKEEILGLIEDRYFQEILDHLRFESSRDVFEREDIREKSRYHKGMIAAYAYVISDTEPDYDKILKEQLRKAFERFSRTDLATQDAIESVKQSFYIQ